MSVCDFCADLDPVWNFDCERIEFPGGVQTVSVGAWLACEECAGLILAGKWRELAETCLRKLKTGQLLVEVAGKDHAIREVMTWHQHFKEHRIGEPWRLSADAGR